MVFMGFIQYNDTVFTRYAIIQEAFKINSLFLCFLVAALFTVAGFYQMAIWALGKHRNYKKEFSNYPRRRKAIVPFLL